MASKQIQFIADLKTELGTQGFATVKEGAYNKSESITEPYEIFILDTSGSLTGTDRAAITETSNYDIFLCIREDQITPSTNIEYLRKTKMGLIKTALYNIKDSWQLTDATFGIQGESSVAQDDTYLVSGYIAYIIRVCVALENSY